MKKNYLLLLLTLLFCACTSAPVIPSPEPTPPSAEQNTPTESAENTAEKDNHANKPGGYYLDDGPEANPPKNLDEIPDAEPKKEPMNMNTNKPYQALGETYVPMKAYQPFQQSGIASWYGKRFHGRKTANGEIYDMYAMTAAHPRLPLPSYVKVTNPSNQKSVIVRVNDRGPFKHSRIIDLSYAAAYKLRIVERGSAPVVIEAVNVDEYLAQNKKLSPVPKQEDVAVNSQIDGYKSSIKAFFVQAGAFKLEANANSLKQKILGLGIANHTDIKSVYNNQLYRLKLGPYATKNKAEKIAAEVRKQLNINSIVNPK